MDHSTHTAHSLDRHRAAQLSREVELRRRAAERTDLLASAAPAITPAAAVTWRQRLTHPIRTLRSARIAGAH